MNSDYFLSMSLSRNHNEILTFLVLLIDTLLCYINGSFIFNSFVFCIDFINTYPKNNHFKKLNFLVYTILIANFSLSLSFVQLLLFKTNFPTIHTFHKLFLFPLHLSASFLPQIFTLNQNKRPIACICSN